MATSAIAKIAMPTKIAIRGFDLAGAGSGRRSESLTKNFMTKT
jgi:hypothetical protein